MPLTTRTDVAPAADAAARYHHPHYQGAVKDRLDHVGFTFALFTGAEPKPTMPAAAWSDDQLGYAARTLLAAEYDAAHSLWREAKYVRVLKEMADGATASWAVYREARRAMDDAFAALSTAVDTRWRAAVSQLVTAQDTVRSSAQAWDMVASRISAVHKEFLYSDLGHSEAYRLAGIDATDWVVGSDYDYQDSWGSTPLARQTDQAIEEQREHLLRVASLTDREPF